MTARRSWWWRAGKCPWCSGQLSMMNVKVTFKNRFRCPYCRNHLRLQLAPLLFVSALLWAPVGVPVILSAWHGAGNPEWIMLGLSALDVFVFFALLAPFFVRAKPSGLDAA